MKILVLDKKLSSLRFVLKVPKKKPSEIMYLIKTMLCLLKVNSNTIILPVNTSYYSVKSYSVLLNCSNNFWKLECSLLCAFTLGMRGKNPACFERNCLDTLQSNTRNKLCKSKYF